MNFITLFSGRDCATCALSFVSAHEALGGARIIAVDDGTVSRSQVDEVRGKTGDWLEIVTAARAYKEFNERMRLSPKLHELLESRRVMQKLFQVDAVAGEAYLYFDCDVVFLRRVDRRALEQDLESSDALISGNPRFCAYSFGFTDIHRIQHSLYRVNSGVFAQRAGLPLLETAAEILEKSTAEYLTRTWVEQSTRAQIYSGYRCKVFSEDAVGEPRFGVGFERQSHLAHFMGSLRVLMKDWRLEDVLRSIRNSAPVRLDAGPARRNSIGLYFADRVKRRLFNKHQIDLPVSPASQG